MAGCGGPTSVLAQLRPRIDGATGVLIYVFDARGRLGMPMKPATKGGAAFSLPGTVVVNVDDNVGRIKLLVEAVDTGVNPLATAFTRDWVVVPPHKQTVVLLTLGRDPPPDCDMDRIPDDLDNCRCKYNPEQTDKNANKVGDVCEGMPQDGSPDTGGGDGGGGDVPEGKSDIGGEMPKDMPGVEPAVDMPPPDMPPAACDPVAGTGCGSGQKCTLDCGPAKAITCLAAGTTKKGDTCTGETSCVARTTCACDTAKVCKCYQYCNGDGDCAAPETCRGNLSCTGDPMGTVRAKICV